MRTYFSYFSRQRAQAQRIQEEIAYYDPNNPEGAVQSVLDQAGLDEPHWRVWLVAASGFFTASYSIFAVNVISPAINYVYPHHATACGTAAASTLLITLTTLLGTIVGMLLFGVLADIYGRKSVYGLELGIVVLATLGMTTASTGYSNSMDIYGWVGFWRFILGIGIGAEYPLSAIIAAEWSSTKSRGRIMAAVFLMQAVGQLAAYGFGLAILHGISIANGMPPDHPDWQIPHPNGDGEGSERSERVIDSVWRTIIGIGAIPALASLFIRRIIPETPYYLAATGSVGRAVETAGRVYNPGLILQPTGHIGDGDFGDDNGHSSFGQEQDPRGGWASFARYLQDTRSYLSEKGRWKALVGICATWFILDVAYYGIGLDNPKTMANIYISGPLEPAAAEQLQPDGAGSRLCSGAGWSTDPAQPEITIYDMLRENCLRNMQTISTGALPGSLLALWAVDYVPRTAWMGGTFVALAALFAVNGATFFTAFRSPEHALTVTLYVLSQLLFNLGPNTMTFILPAELFATQRRATFYGLAAAAGKLGAVVIQLVLSLAVYYSPVEGPNGGGGSDNAERLRTGLGVLLLAMSPLMLAGAAVTWVWIPEVQYPRGAKTAATEEEEGEVNGGRAPIDDGDDDDASTTGHGHGLSGEEGAEATFCGMLKLVNRSLPDIDKNPGRGQMLGARRNLRRLMRRRPRQEQSPLGGLGTTTAPEPHPEMVVDGGIQPLVNRPFYEDGVGETDIGDPRGRY